MNGVELMGVWKRKRQERSWRRNRPAGYQRGKKREKREGLTQKCFPFFLWTIFDSIKEEMEDWNQFEMT